MRGVREQTPAADAVFFLNSKRFWSMPIAAAVGWQNMQIALLVADDND